MSDAACNPSADCVEENQAVSSREPIQIPSTPSPSSPPSLQLPPSGLFPPMSEMNQTVELTRLSLSGLSSLNLDGWFSGFEYDCSIRGVESDSAKYKYLTEHYLDVDIRNGAEQMKSHHDNMDPGRGTNQMTFEEFKTLLYQSLSYHLFWKSHDKSYNHATSTRLPFLFTGSFSGAGGFPGVCCGGQAPGMCNFHCPCMNSVQGQIGQIWASMNQLFSSWNRNCADCSLTLCQRKLQRKGEKTAHPETSEAGTGSCDGEEASELPETRKRSSKRRKCHDDTLDRGSSEGHNDGSDKNAGDNPKKKSSRKQKPQGDYEVDSDRAKQDDESVKERKRKKKGQDQSLNGEAADDQQACEGSIISPGASMAPTGGSETMGEATVEISTEQLADAESEQHHQSHSFVDKTRGTGAGKQFKGRGGRRGGQWNRGRQNFDDIEINYQTNYQTGKKKARDDKCYICQERGHHAKDCDHDQRKYDDSHRVHTPRKLAIRGKRHTAVESTASSHRNPVTQLQLSFTPGDIPKSADINSQSSRSTRSTYRRSGSSSPTLATVKPSCSDSSLSEFE